MPRTSIVAAGAMCIVLLGAAPASADHITTDVDLPSILPADAPIQSEGDIRFIANVPAGNGAAAPLGEGAPFERDGRRYIAASSTTYGLHVVDVTDPMAPVVVSTYSSARGCPTAAAEATRASGPTPLSPLGGWENDQSVTPDGMIAVLGMDADGRCHDPAQGGLEFIDLSDLKHPRALHLTRNVGEAHSVTIDPVRPWLAYTSTSDGADLIDIVDFSSCLGGVAELDACKPDVARVPFTAQRWPSLDPHPSREGDDIATSGCHDIRIVGDTLYCAAVNSTLLLDISGVVDERGRLTGTLLTRGPDACPRVAAVRTDPGVMVTDCYGWTEAAFEERRARGADVGLLSFIPHDGSAPPTEDIATAHQAEPTADGTMMFVTDERGGGLANDDGCPGGGAVFYDIRDPHDPVMMQQPDGTPAIYRTEVNLPGTAHMSCTIHYGEQVGSENLLVFGWYLNGVRMVRFTPDFSTSPATVSFEEVAAYLPTGAWTIQAKPLLRNPDDRDEIIVYTADLNRGIDVLGISVPKLKVPPVKGGTGPKVLGDRTGPTPATGLGDPAVLSLILASLAAFIARRVRAAR